MTGFSALPVSEDGEEDAQKQWIGQSRVLGPEWLKMPILTIGMLGLQIIWSVEMSYGESHALYRLSKSFMSIVFLAGPLSGLIVQPLIGVLSDRSHSRFGRRRPYIFFGALVSFGAMYLLGFTRQFASLVTTKGSPANDSVTIGLAIWSIYCIDFSINAVQAMDRALLVDILPVSEQERGNAWAGRMFGLGSVIGFFVGNIDLTLSLPFLGDTQLEIICVITSCLLIITHFVTVFNVKERTLMKTADGINAKFGLWNILKDILSNFLALPRTIKQICLIQLFAWIGWFPVLFWTSLYVGGLHERNSPLPETHAAQAILEAEATRLGSRALLCNALASLVASIVCPFFVSAVRNRRGGSREMYRIEESGWLIVLKEWWKERPTCHLAVLWSASHGVFAVCMLSTFLIRDVAAATGIMTLSGFSWAITQWAPFALIAEAIHYASYASSSRHVLGDAEIDDEGGGIPLHDTRTNRMSAEEPLGNMDESRRLIFEVKDDDEDKNENENGILPKHVHFEGTESGSRSSQDLDIASPAPLGMNVGAQMSQEDIHVVGAGNSTWHVDDATGDDGVGVSMDNPRRARSTNGGTIEDKAGIILGIHNVFIVIPQFIITGLASILFAIMDPDKSVLTSPGAPAHPGSLPSGLIGNRTAAYDLSTTSVRLPRAEGEAATRSADSVAVIFRIGGVSAGVACVLALRLARELKKARR